MLIKKWIRRTMIRISLFLGIVISIVVIIDGSFLSKTYLDPWDQSYAQKFSDPRLQVISYGLLAANAFNRQAWKIRLSKGKPLEFKLFVDTKRLLPGSDPYSRQITMSQGTFLENARIGASNIGYKITITLFPNGEYDARGTLDSMKEHPVARVSLEKSKTTKHPLFDAITRATFKSKLLKNSVAKNEIQTLTTIKTDSDLEIRIFNDKKNVDRIKSFTIDAKAIDLAASLKTEGNLFRFTEWQKNLLRDGLTFDAFGISGIKKIFMQALGAIIPVSDETIQETELKEFSENVTSVPAYLMIISNGNSREIQVRAGMLYSRLEHLGTTMGLVMQPAEQTLQEYPEMTRLYKKIHKIYAKPNHTIQMLAAFGKPAKQVSLSPRRDVMELIYAEH